jgi:hypothetical protein
MANATEAFLSPSQLVDVGLAVKISCDSNYLFHFDLNFGRRDLSPVEAHHDVAPTCIRIVFRSMSRLWQWPTLTGRGERLTTKPADSSRVGRINACERHGCGAALRAFCGAAHGHRRRAADYDQGLRTASTSYGSQEEYPRCVITACTLLHLDLQGLETS